MPTSCRENTFLISEANSFALETSLLVGGSFEPWHSEKRGNEKPTKMRWVATYGEISFKSVLLRSLVESDWLATGHLISGEKDFLPIRIPRISWRYRDAYREKIFFSRYLFKPFCRTKLMIENALIIPAPTLLVVRSSRSNNKRELYQWARIVNHISTISICTDEWSIHWFHNFKLKMQVGKRKMNLWRLVRIAVLVQQVRTDRNVGIVNYEDEVQNFNAMVKSRNKWRKKSHREKH